MSLNSTLFGRSSLPIVEQVLSFTQARHGVLAGNVANLDTPGYVTRDLSPDAFRDGLKQAIAARSQGKRTALYAAQAPALPEWIQRLPTDGKDVDIAHVAETEDRFRNLLYHDQSDVSIEKQVAEIAKNQAQHNLALQLMVSQFELLRSAISENVA